jgi:hypothetical protein
VIIAHVAGFPVEEMLLTVAPVTGVLTGGLVIWWKDRKGQYPRIASTGARHRAPAMTARDP